MPVIPTKTISTVLTSTYNLSTLTSQYTTITGAGGVVVAAGYAIVGAYVNSTVGWTVTNSGTVQGSAGSGNGIDLRGAGNSVTNTTDGVILGQFAVYVTRPNATVVNHGAIGNTAGSVGVALGGEGTVTNTGAGAHIIGRYKGVYLNRGGVVTNGGGATISSEKTAILSRQGIATLTNAGTIHGATTGGTYIAAIQLVSGARVTNQTTGIILSDVGIGADFAKLIGITGGGVTLNNYGSIISLASQDAVRFPSSYTNLLIVQPGAVFTGGVDGGNTIGSASITTMELASAASIGTLSGIGSHYINFAQITVDASASWKLNGSNTLATGITLTNQGQLSLSATTIAGAGTIANNGTLMVNAGATKLGAVTGTGGITLAASGTVAFEGTVAAGQTVTLSGTPDLLVLDAPTLFAGTVKGFAAPDTIRLAGITDVTSSNVGAGNVLKIIESGGGTINIQLGQAYANPVFPHVINGGNTDITAACFAAGTRIRTPEGAVAIERLRVGDRVCSAFGGTAPVIWTGHRSVDITRHPRPQDVQPVRIAAGAFGPDCPTRDVLLSPDHAVFVDEMLVPVRYLVNDATIAPVPARRVTYWHIELPAHDVVFAEGLPAETYLDTGNRHAFEGGGNMGMLHPDFARARWAAEGCAGLVTQGPVLGEIRAGLLARAAALGFTITMAPNLHIRGAGRRITASEERSGHRFVLPAGGTWRLRSRVHIPAHIHAAHTDHRRLGVAVARLTLDGRKLALDDPRLGAGWHAPEADWRWTDGDAALTFAKGGVLDVRVVMTAAAWVAPADGSAMTDLARLRG